MKYSWLIALVAIVALGCTTASMVRQPAPPTTQEGCLVALERESLMFRMLCDERFDDGDSELAKCYTTADALKTLAIPGCMELPTTAGDTEATSVE